MPRPVEVLIDGIRVGYLQEASLKDDPVSHPMPFGGYRTPPVTIYLEFNLHNPTPKELEKFKQ